MIESQRQIGSLLLENTKPIDFIRYITEGVSKEIKGKKQNIVILNLNTKEGKLEIDNKLIGDTTAEKYIWIGTADGAASPQWYFTTNNLEYLVSQTLPNILKRLHEKSNLYKKLKPVFDNYYYDLGLQKGMKNRYRYVLDLEKLGIPEVEMDKVVKENKGDVKKIVKAVGKLLIDYIKDKLGLLTSEINLWNLKVDGIDIVKEDEYVELVIYEKIGKLYEDKVIGICSLCNEKKVITDNTTRLQFKYYMTDKIGFSSNLSGSFLKNMRLCKDCYRQVLAGESYIKRNMGFFIGGLRVYLVPTFIFTPDKKVVRKNYDGFKYIKDSLININRLIEKEERLDYFSKRDKGNSFILNLLFYEKKQAEFKILKLIKDVSPSRFMCLARESIKTKEIFERFLGPSGMWSVDFNRVYYMFPLKVSGGSPVDYRKLLNLYDDILCDKPIDKRFLINQFVKMAHVHHTKNYRPYNIKKPANSEITLVHGVLQNVVFLKYLENLGLLKGGQGMNVDDLIIADDMKEYIKSLGFDESQTALFLMGYLIGEIAGAQKESNPILNKINYQGMPKTKVQRLVSEVFEKLKQYKVLNYNKKGFSDMKRLFDRQLNNWELSPQDNVFYILSGYAYQVRRVILKSKENKEKEGAFENE